MYPSWIIFSAPEKETIFIRYHCCLPLPDNRNSTSFIIYYLYIYYLLFLLFIYLLWFIIHFCRRVTGKRLQGSLLLTTLGAPGPVYNFSVVISKYLREKERSRERERRIGSEGILRTSSWFLSYGINQEANSNLSVCENDGWSLVYNLNYNYNNHFFSNSTNNERLINII